MADGWELVAKDPTNQGQWVIKMKKREGKMGHDMK